MNPCLCSGNGVRMSKFAQHVKILADDEHSLSWVTTYEVSNLLDFM